MDDDLPATFRVLKAEATKNDKEEGRDEAVGPHRSGGRVILRGQASVGSVFLFARDGLLAALTAYTGY